MGRYKKFIGLGIAGNFALHLDQAGEAEDFKDVVTKDENAPKGVFPFYLPKPTSDVSLVNLKVNKQLFTYPLSGHYIKKPLNKNLNIQAEPEVVLVCRFEYGVGGKLKKITPTHFAAYNDCSIRVKGAKKISDKKNWGENSKGISDTLLEIDTFSEGGVMDNYSICSYLKRDGKIYEYGEDAKLTGYSYFYEQLLDWLVEQIDTQEDSGPLEPIEEYLLGCELPQEALISIGATRYTEFGENTFLQEGDEFSVIVYDHTLYSLDDVKAEISKEKPEHTKEGMSILVQKVID